MQFLHILCFIIFVFEDCITHPNNVKEVRRNKIYDYNYKDWEKQEADIYVDGIKDMTNTSDVNLTASATTPHWIAEPELSSELDKTLPPPSIGFEDLNPLITHTSSTYQPYLTPPTKNPYIKVIMDAHSTLGGYFVAFAVVLLKTLVSKDDYDLTKFSTGVTNRMVALEYYGLIDDFGTAFPRFIKDTAQMFALSSSETLKGLAEYGIYALENRKTTLKNKTNMIIDLTDSVFDKRDLPSFANLITDVEIYPNTTKDHNDIAESFIDIFVEKNKFIQGSVKHKLIMEAINVELNKRFQIQRKFREAKLTNTSSEIQSSTRKVIL